LEENVIYGLLGRNGAGKTTLLNMIAGGIFPNFGTIEVRGKKLGKGELPKDFCFVREKNKHFGGARVLEILQFAANFHPNWDWTLAHELIATFRLDPNKKIKQLSRGTESLVGNIIGLASRASLTFFDEPVLGLDVVMRERFYKALLEDYTNHPRTILLSTHLIDEIVPVAEKVYIIEAGSLLLHAEVDQIRMAAHLIRGNSEAVASFTAGKRVLHTETYGHGTLAAIYETLDEEDMQQANKMNVSIENLTLQKFFSYLIEGGH
jgi:ABC-2 type transport system ATP-binding protein